jgi:hypothetical protein
MVIGIRQEPVAGNNNEWFDRLTTNGKRLINEPLAK